MSLYLEKYLSPIGILFLIADDTTLKGVFFKENWPEYQKRFGTVKKSENSIIKKTKKQLEEYFSGMRKDFDLPYELNGTQFQMSAWKALAKIPFGKTKSYKEQASIVGSEKAVRAIGRANGINPLCIILPCHRVVGSNGSLTGYAGGLEAKKYLLKLEGVEVR